MACLVDQGETRTVEQILNDILARLDRIEAALPPVHGGPSQGQTPGAPVTYDPATAQPVLDALNLGSDGPSAMEVARLLAHGYTVAEIVAQAEKLLASTGLPRGEAAYALNVSSHGVGWQMLTNRVEGRPENPIFSHDPATNLLDGLSNVNGPADLAPVVGEVIARAEQGITWRGTRGLDAADLEAAKVALVADPRPEWELVLDQKLLRVLVCTGVLPVKWEGANAMHAYPLPEDIETADIATWLYGQKLASQ